MTAMPNGGRWRAVVAATFLVLTGGVIGALVDRYWLSPPAAHAAPLTADEMATRLHLSHDDKERLRLLLDSLHTEILGVVQQGPDSLSKAARHAQLRIEAALPPDARAEFREWMQQSHDQLMRRMHGGFADHRAVHGSDSARHQR
jgi:hypothetical protein